MVIFYGNPYFAFNNKVMNRCMYVYACFSGEQFMIKDQ